MSLTSVQLKGQARHVTNDTIVEVPASAVWRRLILQRAWHAGAGTNRKFEICLKWHFSQGIEVNGTKVLPRKHYHLKLDSSFEQPKQLFKSCNI